MDPRDGIVRRILAIIHAEDLFPLFDSEMAALTRLIHFYLRESFPVKRSRANGRLV